MSHPLHKNSYCIGRRLVPTLAVFSEDKVNSEAYRYRSGCLTLTSSLNSRIIFNFLIYLLKCPAWIVPVCP
jgi:hypothetical protein